MGLRRYAPFAQRYYIIYHEKLVGASSLIHISDWHQRDFGEANHQVMDAVAKVKPKLILMTGDLVDSRRLDRDRTVKFVEQAVALAPVYMVTGNHEARVANFDELKQRWEGTGAVVLRDEVAFHDLGGSQVCLVGLDDPDFFPEGKNDQERFLHRRLAKFLPEERGFTLCLAHRPEHMKTYVQYGMDLVLCGHTHGGQVRLPKLGGVFAPTQGLFPHYDGGVYRERKTTMVISRGLGDSACFFRVNNPHELVIIELRGEGE